MSDSEANTPSVPAHDAWQSILNEVRPRESFLEFIAQCEQEVQQGKDAPLTLDDL